MRSTSEALIRDVGGYEALAAAICESGFEDRDWAFLRSDWAEELATFAGIRVKVWRDQVERVIECLTR